MEFTGNRRFEVQRRLGAGAFGIVYEVLDRERDTRVALKTLARLDADALYRFKREFRALSDVHHENIVALHDLFSEGEQWFFTMELLSGVNFLTHLWGPAIVRDDAATGGSISDLDSDLDGETQAVLTAGPTAAPRSPERTAGSDALAMLPDARDGHSSPPSDEVAGAEDENDEGIPLATRPRIDEAVLRDALAQLTRGLARLHEGGTLHCDVKPSNVLVTPEGRVVLLDFGIVTELRHQAAALHGRKQRHGTPTYMAPEQIRGEPLTPACDWYAVGVLLFHALVGRPPFVGASELVLRAKLAQNTPSPGHFVPNVPQDLDALCARLLQRDPQARPSDRELLDALCSEAKGSSVRPSIAAPSAESEGALVIGRDAELATLDAALARTRDEDLVTVFIHGESGMGKSAVVGHFLKARSDEAAVFEGRCYERESLPYKAWDGIIDALTEHLLHLERNEQELLIPPHARVLARLFPVLLRVPAVAGQTSSLVIGDAQKLRLLAFGALGEILARLSRKRPLILFIDDLQWGDEDSASLLSELAFGSAKMRVLLVVGHREDERNESPPLRALAPLREIADGTARVFDVGVGRLAPPDAERLASLLLAKGAGPGLARTLAEEGRGNPFFIGELARYASTPGGTLRRGELRLERVVAARVAELPSAARSLLEVLSVASRPLRRAVLRSAAGLEPADEAQAISTLRAAHLLKAASVDAQESVEPYHDRIREAVYLELDAPRVQAIHSELVVALNSIGETDPQVLFTHLRGAGMHAQALACAEAAAEAAERGLAFGRAAQFYEYVLELLPNGAPRAHATRVARAKALANAGLGRHAAEAYLVAAAQAPAHDEFELRRLAAEHFLFGGYHVEGLEALRGVLAALGMRLAPTFARAIMGLLALRVFLWMRGLRYIPREAAECAPPLLAKLDACLSVAHSLATIDNVRAAQFGTRALALALRAGEPWRLSRALSIQSAYLGSEGARGYRAARSLAAQAASLAEQCGKADVKSLARVAYGSADFFSGNWKMARVGFEEGIAIQQEHSVGSIGERDYPRLFGLSTLFYLGDLRTLAKRVRTVMREAQERGNWHLETNLRVGDTSVYWLLGGDASAARKSVEDAVRSGRKGQYLVQDLFALFALTRIDLYDRRGEAALDRIDKSWAAVRGSFLLRLDMGRINLLHSRACARLARFRARGGKEYIALATRDARRLGNVKALWAEGLSAQVHAGACACAGRPDEALTFLQKAVVLFKEADMALHAAASQRRIGQLLGGDEGHAQVREAEAWMSAEGIADPPAMGDSLTPGFD